MPRKRKRRAPIVKADPAVSNQSIMLPESMHLKGPRCEHPNSRNAGWCPVASIGEFDIPDSYEPPNRHPSAGPRPLRRPKAFLCRRHAATIKAATEGIKMAGNSHEAMCAICQHPRGAHMLEMWANWEIGTTAVLIELHTTHAVFYNHVHYFGIDEQKAAKPGRKRLLLALIEKGVAAGGHSVRTALSAAALLQRDDPPPPPAKSHVQVDHNVSGAIGVGVALVDVAAMSSMQMAEEAESIARQLRELAEAKQSLAALPPDLAAELIDLPPSAVRDVTPVGLPLTKDGKPDKRFGAKAGRAVSRSKVQHGRR